MHKLTLVLAGLFVMMAGLIGVIAYTTNNQAFVKAQVIIPVNFGNVFPGQTVTESFTITSPDSSGYSLTLMPAPLDPNVTPPIDIRPYLSVWKDPAETDLDGPISGAPAYTGNGSFTNPNDLSDKWFVTFNVPDVELAPGVAIDYGCQIVITSTSPHG